MGNIYLKTKILSQPGKPLHKGRRKKTILLLNKHSIRMSCASWQSTKRSQRQKEIAPCYRANQITTHYLDPPRSTITSPPIRGPDKTIYRTNHPKFTWISVTISVLVTWLSTKETNFSDLHDSKQFCRLEPGWSLPPNHPE